MQPRAHKSEAGDANPPSSTSGEMYELDPQNVYPRPRLDEASLAGAEAEAGAEAGAGAEASVGGRSASERTSLRNRTVPKSVSAMCPVS